MNKDSEYDNIRRSIDKVFEDIKLYDMFINESNMTCMGGFARRSYMDHYNIKMHNDDHGGDIDIYLNIIPIILYITHMNNSLKDASTSEIIEEFKNDRNKIDIDYIIELIVYPIISSIYNNREFSLIGDHSFKRMCESKINNNSDLDDIFSYSSVDFLNEYKQYFGNVLHYKPEDLRLMLPITDKIQIIMCEDIYEEMNLFDMDQSKFKLNFPLSKCIPTKESKLLDHRIYYIDNVFFERNKTNILKTYMRLEKYSSYGFMINENVINDFYSICDECDDMISSTPYLNSNSY